MYKWRADVLSTLGWFTSVLYACSNCLRYLPQNVGATSRFTRRPKFKDFENAAAHNESDVQEELHPLQFPREKSSSKTLVLCHSFLVGGRVPKSRFNSLVSQLRHTWRRRVRTGRPHLRRSGVARVVGFLPVVFHIVAFTPGNSTIFEFVLYCMWCPHDVVYWIKRRWRAHERNQFFLKSLSMAFEYPKPLLLLMVQKSCTTWGW